MIPRLDITKDVCPMTFVKVRLGLHNIAPSGKLNVRLKEEALKNVIAALKAGGHRVTNVSREGTIFLLEVEKISGETMEHPGNGDGGPFEKEPQG